MDIHGIFSQQPQMGKTTWVFDLLSGVWKKEDSFYLCHDLKSVRQDALTKAEVYGLEPYDLEKCTIKQISKNIYKGEHTPTLCFGLGNIQTFKRLEFLLNWKFETGTRQRLIVDEIHKFLLEEEGKHFANRDIWLKRCIQNDFVEDLVLISATPHDLLISPFITFKYVDILDGYDGYKGFEEVDFKIRSSDYFDEIRQAFKDDKKPPTEFIDDVLSEDNMLINLKTEKGFHRWLEEYIPDTLQFNSDRDEVSRNLAGGHKFGMSATFDHNCMIYNRRSKAHRAAVIQTLGRVLGPRRGRIFCTQNDKDEVEHYLDFQKKYLKRNILLLPADERIAKIKEAKLLNPRSWSNPKAKRQYVDTKKEYKKGELNNCVEEYHSIHMGETYTKEDWRGDGGDHARQVFQTFKEQNPDIDIPDGPFKAIQEKEEVYKFRGSKREAVIRAGINYDKPGRCYIILVRGEYEGDYSFYNYDGTLLSNQTTNVGCIL